MKISLFFTIFLLIFFHVLPCRPLLLRTLVVMVVVVVVVSLLKLDRPSSLPGPPEGPPPLVLVQRVHLLYGRHWLPEASSAAGPWPSRGDEGSLRWGRAGAGRGGAVIGAAAAGAKGTLRKKENVIKLGENTENCFCKQMLFF